MGFGQSEEKFSEVSISSDVTVVLENYDVSVRSLVNIDREKLKEDVKGR